MDKDKKKKPKSILKPVPLIFNTDSSYYSLQSLSVKDAVDACSDNLVELKLTPSKRQKKIKFVV